MGDEGNGDVCNSISNIKKKRTCGKLGHGPEKKGAGLKNSYMINCYNLNIY